MIAELIFPIQRQNVLLKFFITLCLSYISYVLYYKLKAFLRVYKLASTITGPRAYPIIGNVLTTYENRRVAVFERKTSKLIAQSMNHLQNDIVRMWIFHKLFIIVKDPNHAQEVLRNINFRKSDYYKTLFGETALGQGLLTNIDTESWKKQRKTITPTFHFKILHTYIKYFYKEAHTLCEIIGQEATNEKAVAIDCKLKLAGFDMIVTNVLGIHINAQKNPNHPFLMNIIETMQITQLRINQPWLLNQLLFRISGYHRKQKKATQAINAFIQDVITMKRKEDETQINQNNNVEKDLTRIFGSSKLHVEDAKMGDKVKSGVDIQYEFTKTKSFLDMLLEIGQGSADDMLTDEEIQRELTTLFFAAQDTTSTTNVTTLLLLAMHPEILQKVTAEIDSIFGGPEKDDGRQPTPDDLSLMVYLECVIKENSRLYPAGPMLPRQVDEEIMLGRHLLPANTSILVFVPAIHRNRSYWHNPKQFIPDRFSPDESISSPHIVERHPYAFIPFSAGPRNCIGQKYAMFQMKTIISTILRRFHLRPSPDFQTIRDIDKKISMDVTLRLEEGAVIFVHRRQK